MSVILNLKKSKGILGLSLWDNWDYIWIFIPKCEWDVWMCSSDPGFLQMDSSRWLKLLIMWTMDRKSCVERCQKEETLIYLKCVRHSGGEYTTLHTLFFLILTLCVCKSNNHFSQCVFVCVHTIDLVPGTEADCCVLCLHSWSSRQADFMSNTDCDHFLLCDTGKGSNYQVQSFERWKVSVSPRSVDASFCDSVQNVRSIYPIVEIVEYISVCTKVVDRLSCCQHG